MLNVLFVGSVYPTIHGASSASRNFVENVKIQNEVNIRLLNTRFNNSIETIEKFSFTKIFKLFFYLLKLILILGFNKTDIVVIAHSFRWSAFYKDSLFIRLSKLFNVKIILYAHSIGFKDMFYESLSIRRREYVDRVLKNINSIVVVSEIMKSEYTKWFDFEYIYKIFNVCEPIVGIDESINRKNESINLLYLSFISEVKGIFNLLRVFKNMVVKHKNIRLIICGSFLQVKPKEKSMFWDYINDNNLKEYVDFRGQVLGQSKKNAFLDADIFVLPTLRESFGIVNIEAMSAGLPVISTKQGAIPEYISEGENGFLLNPGDNEGLEEKLELLILNKELRELIGKNNKKKFHEYFSINQFRDNWLKVICNI